MLDKSNLFWIDLEMTGLNEDINKILELAFVITTKDLDIIYTSNSFQLKRSSEELSFMDEWNIKTHTKSGLLEKVKVSTLSETELEKKVLEITKEFIPQNTSPICGSSVYMDRIFMRKYLPNLNNYFHYRNIDVSSLKELASRWYIDLPKFVYQNGNEHSACSDILGSIDLLRFYRENIFLK